MAEIQSTQLYSGNNFGQALISLKCHFLCQDALLSTKSGVKVYEDSGIIAGLVMGTNKFLATLAKVMGVQSQKYKKMEQQYHILEWLDNGHKK